MKRLLVPSISILLLLSSILTVGCQKQSTDVIRTTSESTNLTTVEGTNEGMSPSTNSSTTPTTSEAATSSTTPSATPEASENINGQTPVNDFTINKDGMVVSLHDWDNEVDLEIVFGEPLSQETIELEDGFTGSLLKKITYDGIELELFSPLGNRKHFWIMTMMITKAGYVTPKGIEVGSTKQQIEEAYPSIEIANDGRNESDEFAYEISDDQDNQNNYLIFEIKAGVVAHIKIFHLIP